MHTLCTRAGGLAKALISSRSAFFDGVTAAGELAAGEAGTDGGGAEDQEEIDAEDDAELQAALEEELAELESAEQEAALGEEQQQPPCKRTRCSK